MQATETTWLPIAEAARQLGVSVDTARRRVKRGELVAERRQTAQGFTWWVCLAGAEMGMPTAYVDAELGSVPPMQNDQLGSTPRRQSEAAHLAELVREFQGEVLRRTEAAATWQARAEFLAGQLESARDEIRALAAPESSLDASTASQPQKLTPNTFTRWPRGWIAVAVAALAIVAVVGLLTWRW